MMSINLCPNKLIDKNKERSFNIGYLYSKSILRSLGIKNICDDISNRYQFKFELDNILCDLVFSIIVYPGSKRSSYKDASHFIEHPNMNYMMYICRFQHWLKKYASLKVNYIRSAK